MTIIDDLRAEVEHSKSVVAVAKKVYEDQDASTNASQANLEAQLRIFLADLKATHDDLETFVSAKATASATAPAAAAPIPAAVTAPTSAPAGPTSALAAPTPAAAMETTMPLRVP